MKISKKISVFCSVVLIILCSFTGCGEIIAPQEDDGKIHYRNEIDIDISDDKITANGRTVYKTISNIYISNDVVYYEDKDFYESGRPYGLGTDSDKHSAEEAAEVTVLNIMQAGTYRLHGKLSNGQIRIDLSKRARENANAVVTLIFDGLDVNCDIAPAIIFKNVFECDLNENPELAASDVDTSKAGANIIIADGSVNNISGSHVAKIFKDKKGEKKQWKQDGTIYSYMSMNIYGEPENSGILNVTSDFEGISTEKHITINGGNIFIVAQNDGINVNNECSVAAINGGNMRIMAGLSEDGGDGIDSNGWIVTNGGTTVSVGHRLTDSGMDDEKACYLNGGTFVSFGSMVDWAELDSKQACFNLQFKEDISTSRAITITDKGGNIVFCYDLSDDEILSPYPSRRMGVVISSPNFSVGDTYNIYLGGRVDGEEYYGLYENSSVKGIDDPSLQGYYRERNLVHGGYELKEMKDRALITDFVMRDTVSGFIGIGKFIKK